MKHKSNPQSWMQAELFPEQAHLKLKQFLRQELSIGSDAELEERLESVMEGAIAAELHKAAGQIEPEHVQAADTLKGILTIPEVRVLLGEQGKEIVLFENYHSFGYHQGREPDQLLTASAHEIVWREEGDIRRFSIDSPIETYVALIPYGREFYSNWGGGDRYMESVDTRPRMIIMPIIRGLVDIAREGRPGCREKEEIVRMLSEDYKE
ncbi:TPA: hypothetical protein HA265_07300 [Candidatus Woesearchaeota archaeon]|nr:hypothetical protein [Candidatus Woesearchaeota archaeon]